MLQLINISKKYKTGELVQIALNNVSLNFRDNEFVSILGPSGSGKTTLLNIIGGLDHYDSGDLIINNISTKKYKDRDWDSYRNHTIGFVFQSYNLIPHQSVLTNVELALTISGVSKKERKKKALEALEKVGLKDQAHKKPNQMSGGQMQRVAIARALVNNPDILLADEPTGALDTTTSVQVMELLKEVAKDRLVIMVTHNPELAEKYSTRIVNLKDGKITGDTNPFYIEEAKEKPKHKNLGKSSMSRTTAFFLSLNNLLSKKGRTILTAFAGSIGIIGIALILSLSTGFQNYVDKIQEDTLTSYPLTIQEDTADMTSLLMTAMNKNENINEIPDKTVEEQQNINNLFGTVGKNNLKAFKTYIEENQAEVDEMVNLVRYNYDVTPIIYRKNEKGEILKINPSDLISNLMGSSSGMMESIMSMFAEIPEDEKMAKEQYEIIEGELPKEYNEIAIVLPTEKTISDFLLYGLGIKDTKELEESLSKLMKGEKIENLQSPLRYTYDELKSLELRVIDGSNIYKYNEKYNIYEDMSDDEEYMSNVYEEGLPLKVVGIVKSESGTNTAGVLYTKKLTEYVINKAEESEIVKKQLENEDINIFSGKSFNEKNNNTGIDFQDLITIDEKAISSAFNVKIDEKDIENITNGYMKEISESITADYLPAQNDFINNLSVLSKNILNSYIKENAVSGIAVIKLSEVENIVKEGLENNDTIFKNLEEKYVISKDTFKQMYNGIIAGFLKQYISMMAGVSSEIPSIQGYSNKEIESKENLAEFTNVNKTKQKEEEVLETDENMQKNVESENVEENTRSENTENGSTENGNKENGNQENENAENGNAEKENEENGNAENGNTENGNTENGNIGSGNTENESGDKTAVIVPDLVNKIVDTLANQEGIVSSTREIAIAMTEATMQKTILTKVGELTGELMETLASSFNIDTEKFANAFKFEMNEDEIRRLMESMSATSAVENAETNLLELGYQNIDEPSSIYFYFKDFESKEKFLEFLDNYNEKMKQEDEEKVINYTDLTGLLMSSIKTIIDSVSYVLIAFVSISLIVSSIMIGIITYISVLERTKEIGILRAIGASKKNISSIFNAETFIEGLFAGLLGIGVTLLMLIPINLIIHSINTDITAVLPMSGAITLIILSIILTLVGGLIPSKAGAKKDPVLALRTE